MSKSKAGKKTKDKKLKKVKAAPKLAKAKRKAPSRVPAAQAAPQAPQSAPEEPTAPQSAPSAPVEAAASGGHLDAPSAGAHPGAGHQSVVRSEVRS